MPISLFASITIVAVGMMKIRSEKKRFQKEMEKYDSLSPNMVSHNKEVLNNPVGIVLLNTMFLLVTATQILEYFIEGEAASIYIGYLAGDLTVPLSAMVFGPSFLYLTNKDLCEYVRSELSELLSYM